SPVLGDGFRDPAQRHTVNHNVLVIGSSAVADFCQPGRLDQCEALTEHSWRRIELAQLLPVRRMIAGLFFEFARRAFERVLTVGLVADQARWQFEAELAERNAKLLDQDRLTGVDRQHHCRAHAPWAAGVLPAPATLRLDELARPFDLLG